jgi:outer membrane lipoprotein-sorting protein
LKRRHCGDIRGGVAVLALVMLFTLQGCSETPEYEGISEFYSGLESMTAKAEVVADFADYATSFELDYSYDGENKSAVSVLSPEEISGVRVIMEESSSRIEYGDVSIEAGDAGALGLSPVAAIPELMRLWRGGIVSESGKEKLDETDCVTVTYKTEYDGEELLCRTWFDAETYKPVTASVFFKGRVTLTCNFKLVAFG